MLGNIIKFLGMILMLFLKYFRKKEKAREVLSDTPVIDDIKREADRKAEDKYGPRTTPTKE